MFDNDKDTILYKCPYCVAGRFTAADGWAGAVRHIKENHTRAGKRRRRQRKEAQLFLDEGDVCYSEREPTFAPA